MVSNSNNARDKFIHLKMEKGMCIQLREAVVLEKLCGTGPGVTNFFVN